MKKYLKEIALLIIIAAIFSNILSFYRGKELNSTKLTLENLTFVNESSYVSAANKPFILYFWGAWCPICKITSPNIQILSAYYNVVSIAVKSGSNDDIKNYLKEHNLSFNTVNDNNAELAKAMQISIFPTIMIYDADGKLFYSDVGYTTTFMLLIKSFLASF